MGFVANGPAGGNGSLGIGPDLSKDATCLFKGLDWTVFIMVMSSCFRT